jgi:putative endonuclease
VKRPAVYILTNRHRGVLYTGVTSQLGRRTWEHRCHDNPRSFTQRYNLATLVYYEAHGTMQSAIAREKQIKGWVRRKKIALIEARNPTWRDLSADL